MSYLNGQNWHEKLDGHPASVTWVRLEWLITGWPPDEHRGGCRLHTAAAGVMQLPKTGVNKAALKLWHRDPAALVPEPTEFPHALDWIDIALGLAQSPQSRRCGPEPSSLGEKKKPPGRFPPLWKRTNLRGGCQDRAHLPSSTPGETPGRSHTSLCHEVIIDSHAFITLLEMCW